MVDKFRGSRFIAVGVSILLCLAAWNTAGAAIVSPVLFSVEATNAEGSGTFEYVDEDPSFIDGTYAWNLDGPVEIVDTSGVSSAGTAIAKVEMADVGIDADPVLSLNFSVSAGASPTTFTISSPHLLFAAISPAVARASASITVTDNTGDGASYTGGYVAGTKSYQANYNGLLPAGTLFTNLIDNGSTPTAFDSVTGQEDFPLGGGFTGLASVSSMSTQYKFTVGAGDGASGTSTFVVLVPEPSSLVLILLGTLLVIRRRG